MSHFKEKIDTTLDLWLKNILTVWLNPLLYSHVTFPNFARILIVENFLLKGAS